MGDEEVGTANDRLLSKVSQFHKALGDPDLVKGLAQFGLSLADFDVFATIACRAGTEAVNVREFHAMTLSTSSVTKRLDRPESASLVERFPDPSNRPGVLIKFIPG